MRRSRDDRPRSRVNYLTEATSGDHRHWSIEFACPTLRCRDRRGSGWFRAILHNVAREGLESQNRVGHPRFAEHLEGRVSWAASLNPARRPTLERLHGAAVLRGTR